MMSKAAGFLSLKKALVAGLLVALALAALLHWRGDRPAPALTQTQWVEVRPQPVSQTLTLSGRIESAESRTLSAPFAGRVKRLLVQPGDAVTQGQPLLELDTLEVDGQIREAEAAWLKAQREWHSYQNWQNSSQMVRLRRTLQLNAQALDVQQRTLTESQRLYERGIISRNELESQQQQVRSSDAELQSLRREYQEQLQEGQGAQLNMAEMAHHSAESRLRALQAQRSGSTMTAPINGVLSPVRTEGEENGKDTLQADGLLRAGQPLLRVASVGQLKTTALVAETDVHLIQPGQPVSLQGSAFDISLKGEVQRLAPFAQAESQNNASALFPVEINIAPLDKKALARVRPGMTVQIEIEIYHHPQALLVPAAAIQQQGDKFRVNFRSSDADAAQEIEVIPQRTFPQGVEVNGIKPGWVSI